MKKIVFATLIMFLIWLGLTFNAQAAGTITATHSGISKGYNFITVTCTADSTGALTAATINLQEPGYVVLVVTVPGTPAPTANYKLTLLDENGVDIMGCTAGVATCTDGSLINRSATLTEQALPKINGAYGSRWVQTSLQVNVANIGTNAVTVLKIYMAR